VAPQKPVKTNTFLALGGTVQERDEIGGVQVWITQFYLPTTPHLPLPVVRQRAPRLNEQLQHFLADEAYYSLIDPVRMKG